MTPTSNYNEYVILYLHDTHIKSSLTRYLGVHQS